MEETDIALSWALLQNSRTPYRALASRLNLSVNVVHKRIQAMVGSGVIRGFARAWFNALTG
ncbi:MAG: winged helix-turn-helix transcriptional regulator [Candidatus Bathyarchaeia archaeon]